MHLNRHQADKLFKRGCSGILGNKREPVCHVPRQMSRFFSGKKLEHWSIVAQTPTQGALI